MIKKKKIFSLNQIKPVPIKTINPFKQKRQKPIKKIPTHFKLDTDRDGVLDFKDCQPFNYWKQDSGFDKFKRNLQSNLRKLNIIKVVNGYGIYKIDDLYYAVDMSTGLTVLNNRRSLSKITRELKEGLPERMRKEQRFSDLFSLKEAYQNVSKSKQYHKKYGNKAKRFSTPNGVVLDIGAGSNPDMRATHAIDLVKPDVNFSDINYKWGYDFNRETTDLPYPSNYFDVVVSYGAYGRNFLSKNIAKEIYRVLKPGGHFECNPDRGVDLLSEVGFKIYGDSYYDEYLGQNVEITRAIKNV